MCQNILPKTDMSIENIFNSSNMASFDFNGLLKRNYNMKITNEQFQFIYNKLKSQISSNKSQIIQTENVIFQISTLAEQKNNNSNISSIDLGECETILKNNSGLSDDDDLIIYKIDTKNSDSKQTYVQYEVYNPKTLNIMSLDECKDIHILINTPVNLNEITRTYFTRLRQSGYNLFDLKDDFYNNICSTYTTENGTDLTLADRKNIIYDNNGDITLCQQGCISNTYNLTTNKSQCECSVQTSEIITNINEINFKDSNIKDEFFNTLNNSNFRLLKCFELILSVKGQKNNIGSYIMSGLFFIFVINFLVYIFKGNYKLNRFINEIIHEKLKCTYKNKEKRFNKGNDLEIFHENKTNKTNIQKINIKVKIKIKKRKTNKNNKTSEELFPPRKKITTEFSNEIISFKSNINKLNTKQSKTIDKIKNENPIKLSSNKNQIKTLNNNDNNNNIKNEQDLMPIYRMEDLTDLEINNLSYEKALILDKRTYFQYYFSLLKKKQLILFIFYPNKDYNLLTAKISLLILSFSLYFTINGFFFTDATMNKINEDHGVYNFFFQIPQLIYSTLISSVINFILRLLSLTERQILTIKQERDLLNLQQNSNRIIKCLKIKLAIFFILSFLFMLFFWYFISCFCAVYKNTQIILIIDTLISFALSMIYPFVLNLFPGFLRIYTLKMNTKDRKCLYILSGYISLI